jgi:hypothetical protein
VKRSVWAGRPRREKGRGADGTKSGVERRISKFSKGASLGEPSLAGFGGVVFQGEAKAGKSWRRGGAMGAYKGTRGGRDALSLRLKGPEWSGRPFVEAQTRSASGAKPSIVAGANGRVSGTEGFSG